jgi:arsenate reductase (glutaredoxin)
MSKTTIYHNPRCTKSRETLALVKDQGAEIEIIEYLKNPPSAEELDNILNGLGKEPIELMRVKEKLFKDLGLTKKDDRPRAEWIQIMVDNPKLIERPVVVHQGKYALGRPPESILEIF